MDRKACSTTRERGLSAERFAQAYLEVRGYRFIEANFRWRGGEIDLALVDPGGSIVFVEVRSAHAASGWLRYTIGPGKRRRLINTASRYFLARPWLARRPYRFDVVWVEAREIEHWKNVLMI